MVHGNPTDRIVVVEAHDAWSFSAEINSVLAQEPLFYVDSSYVDAYLHKAILVKRCEKTAC